MNSFFDDWSDDDSDRWDYGGNDWKGEDPEAWKGESSDRGKIGTGVSPLEKDLEKDFEANGRLGFDILRKDLYVVCDLIDILTRDNALEKKPFFVYTQLILAREDLMRVVESSFCRHAVDRDRTLTEVSYVDESIVTLMEKAYHKMEFDV